MSTVKSLRTGVLVVGAGPVGVTLQLLLARMRIPCMLVEKNIAPRSHPRAHYLSNRSMEVWRQLGHLDKALECIVEPLEYWRYFKYCRHIIDPERNLYGVQDHFAGHHRYNDTYFDELSPSRISNLPQHKLLFILKSVALERSQVFNDREACLSWLKKEYKSVMLESTIDQDKVHRLSNLDRPFHLPTLGDTFERDIINVPLVDGGLKFERFISEDMQKRVLSEVTNMRDGTTLHIESAFVVGTDGIHSRVRKELFEFTDTQDDNVKDTLNLREVMSVHFQSKQLGDYVSSNPAMMYFIFSRCICVLVCQGGEPPEFVVQIPFFPAIESEKSFDEASCRALINEAVGTELTDLKIFKIKKWTVSTDVAKSYIDKESCRVILAGDSAHIVAPAGGLGMNMGIADTYSLAWRLGRIFYNRLLHQGANTESTTLSNLIGSGLSNEEKKLIRDYSTERRAVAEYTRDVCLKEVENGSKFAKYLGYNHSLMQNGLDFLSRFIPSTLGKLPPLFDAVKIIMKHVYNTPRSMETIRKTSEHLFSKCDGSLGLSFPGSDLAYAYTYTKDGEHVLKVSDTHRSYIPQSVIGRRVPHTFVYSKLGSDNEGGDSTVYKISTVDLPSFIQPPIYYCFLVFSRDIASKLLDSLKGDKGLFYICLWDSRQTLGLESPVTIKDQFLSMSNSEINAIGCDKLYQNLKQYATPRLDHNFIFLKLDGSTDFQHFYGALETHGFTPIKTVISSRLSLERFSKSLFGKNVDMNNTVILIRPDGHIADYRTGEDVDYTEMHNSLNT
ncbi:conserved hypothetical protein [Theileria equi strain WA]|uniref:FAD-binding domain-containing protein n=1 Tax=Theileria equi strain WA TaxID=1537102 RepID=L1LDN6_THEEQ|nr:conserved hypothetical protein [Theileria equi strain WA]EKX73466.1 conserved hypothetical protein [Theileria equi strain WA]|eukprot:XP_004832918.1 conserved hypothetical protein [Theileria equi strain WA]